MDRDRREIRQLKRDIKRAGGKRRRRQLKQAIVERPEEAHEAAFDFGRLRSATLNGIDRDATRIRPDRQVGPVDGDEPI